MNRWFVSQQGKLQGPYTLPQLQAMVRAGDLKPADMVCPEGGAPTTANRVPGLFAQAAPPKPALPKAAPAKPASSPAVVAGPAPLPKAPSTVAAGNPAPPRVKAATTPPPAAKSSQTGILIAVGIFVGVLLLGCLPVTVIGMAYFLSGKKPDGPPIVQNDKVPPPPIVEKKDGNVVTPPTIKKEKKKKKPDDPPDLEDPPEIAPKLNPVKAVEPMADPKITEAVERGVKFLRQRLAQNANVVHSDAAGYGQDQVNLGATALTGLALLEAKVPPNDPDIQRVLTTIRDNGPKVRLIYTLGSVLFFLNRLHEAEPLKDSDRQLVRTLALRLISGQHADGRWTYFHNPLTAQEETRLLDELNGNRYKPWVRSTGTPPSNSMTQFALLALWGSRKHGIPARPAMLLSAARFHVTQNSGGSWDYNRSDNPHFAHDSNTCAGLIALAMEKSLRGERDFKNESANAPPANPNADEQCDKAFAHLAKVIGRTRNTPTTPATIASRAGTYITADAWGDLYFLWCLERVSVIYDRKEIGGKDWYDWGSKVILKNQLSDGSWSDRHGNVPDTCFAILFLTRANLARDLTEEIRTRGGIKAK